MSTAKLVSEFVKQFDRPTARQKPLYVEYRGLNEVDLVIEQARGVLERVCPGKFEIVKIPELRGFGINFKE